MFLLLSNKKGAADAAGVLHFWVMLPPPPKSAATPLMTSLVQLFPASPHTGSLLHSQHQAAHTDTAHQQNVKIAENI